MPAKQWSGQVSGAEYVETAGKDRTGDTVKGRGVPCYLGLVDTKVRGDRAIQALFDENIIAVSGFDRCRCCLSKNGLARIGDLL